MGKHIAGILVVLAIVLFVSPLVVAAPPEPEKAGAGLAPQADHVILAKVEPLVFKELEQKGTTIYLVYLREKADLKPAQTVRDKLSRRQAVVAALQETAKRSQAPILLYLRQQERAGKVKAVASYWIFNGLAVTGDRETLLALAARPDVERIQANHVRRIGDARGGGASPPLDAASPSAVEWNVSKVRANEVWDVLGITGQGVVVANIDTGVYYPHPALLGKYRGYNNGAVDHSYNWFDPTGSYPSAPYDGHGHGTHTMGTMVGAEPNGSNQIGVAPGARWVAVKAFDDDGYTSDAILHASFQWVMAPTNLQGQNPDPSKAPDIVSNSWGDENGSDTTFWQDVLALRAAGIMPVFAAGNNGPGVGTVDSPGSFPQSFAVGATNINDVVAGFSGRGPSPWGELKPEVVAPGVNVRSAVPPVVNPAMYEGGWSGTSMATPHGAGLTALIWQVRPDLTVTATEYALTSTTFPLPDEASSPNNTYGWGRLDAFQAVSTIMNGGRFWGRVTDAANGQPVAAVNITMLRQDGDGSMQTMTDAQGYYTITVAAGLYQVTATNFWYITQTVRDVEISPGFTTILDFALVRKPSGVLRGQVLGNGVPVSATINLAGMPATVTAGANGVYSVTLPAGLYDMRVRPPVGYRQATASAVVVTAGAETVRDFDLPSAPRILLVDADAFDPFASRISYWRTDLDDLLYTFDQWAVLTPTTGLPPTATLQMYNIILWHQPSTSPGYIGAWPRLASYLDNGGRLLISGQDIGYWDDSGSSRFYYRGYLHAQLVRDSAGLVSVQGIQGELFTGISLTMNTGDSAANQTDPDVVTPFDAAATPALTYTMVITSGLGAGTTPIAGLAINTPSYQALYLPFGLEGVGPRQARQQTLRQALAWLSLPVLSKRADNINALPGDTMNYTLRLTNHSAQMVSGLSIVDPLPTGLTYVPGSATGGLVYDPPAGSLSWQGAVSANSTLTFTFQAVLGHLPGGLTVLNTANLGDGSGLWLPTSAGVLVTAADLSTSQKVVSPIVAASGQEITYTIWLTNTGSSASPVFVADAVPAGTTYVPGSEFGGALYNLGQNRIEWTGAVTVFMPTTGGYTFRTSDEVGGPLFSWIDISGVGTHIPAGDDTIHGPFAIGFPFTFFDKTYTSFYLSSNGWLSFQSQSSSAYSNVCLPDPSAPRAMLAGWWDDLNPGASGDVYYLSSSDSLVVSFVSVPRFVSGGPYTFQFILRDDGTITYQYLDMQGTRLNEATIGLQDDSGLNGLSVACNEDYVHNELAIRFTPISSLVGETRFGFRARVDDDLPPFTIITNTALASSAGVTYTLSATAVVNTVDLTTSEKTVDKPLAGFGDTLVYSVTISNTGTAIGTAVLTDALPLHVLYVPGSASNGASYEPQTHSILWSGLLSPNARSVISFAVVLAPGLADNAVIINTAQIADPSGRIHQRSAQTLYRAPDLSLSRKEVMPDRGDIGQVVTFTVTVANDGGGATAFLVTDTLPAGLVLVPGTLETGHGVAGYDVGQRRITWTGYVPGQHQTYLRFAALLEAGGTLVNTVQIQDMTGVVLERMATVVVTAPTPTPTATPTATMTPTVTPTPTATPGPVWSYWLYIPIVHFSNE